MELDFTTIYNELSFLSESVRLQYTNFIWRNKNRFNEYLSFDDAVYRIRMEEPIEYVFNMAEFCNEQFYVDKRCLIPRPETLEIVKMAVDFCIQHRGEKFTIVDVGTGSGCIILSIALKLKTLSHHGHRFIGIDISDDALEVARINRTAFNLGTDITLVHSSFQDFDFASLENLIICSNLPYIPTSDEVQKSVTDFEPHIALFGGNKGDELNNQLINMVEKSPNLKILFMEGYNGEISAIKPQPL